MRLTRVVFAARAAVTSHRRVGVGGSRSPSSPSHGVVRPHKLPSKQSAVDLGGDLVLAPESGARGREVGLVLIPGISIDSNAYLPLLSSLQRSAGAAGLRLFAGCAHFDWASSCSLSQLTVLEDLRARMDRTIQAMRAKGLQAESPLFHAAHSLSTAFLQDCLAQSSASAGQILMGGCLLRKHCYPSFTYKVPTLTVCGAMDGTEPIMRQAEQHRIQSSLDQTKFPMVVLEGQTHMQFASGPTPRHVKQDLPPFVPDDAARAATGELVVDFVRTRLGIPGAGEVLDGRLQSTQAQLMPVFMSIEQQSVARARSSPGPAREIFVRHGAMSGGAGVCEE